MFIDKDLLIKKYNIIIKKLLVLKPLYLTNRLLSSFITYYFTVKMIIGHHTKYYGPSIISVTVTKGGHPRGGGLYKTSRTIGRGVTESCKKFST